MSNEIKTEIEPVDNPGILDKLRSKLVSRKFLVWLTGTVALFMGTLESQHYVALSLVYIGVVGLAEIAAIWRKAK